MGLLNSLGPALRSLVRRHRLTLGHQLSEELDHGWGSRHRHLEGEGAMGLSSSVVFSLQNLFSASFQSARVTSIYTLALAALQRIAGLLTNAMVTGLFFLGFTKVDAPLRFSRNLCLSFSPGGHLSCRFVTRDPTCWLRVSYSMVLFLDEEIESGVVQRRLHSLPLLNSSTPQLHVTAVLSHSLGADSPFVRHGMAAIRRASGASWCWWKAPTR